MFIAPETQHDRDVKSSSSPSDPALQRRQQPIICPTQTNYGNWGRMWHTKIFNLALQTLEIILSYCIFPSMRWAIKTLHPSVTARASLSNFKTHDGLLNPCLNSASSSLTPTIFCFPSLHYKYIDFFSSSWPAACQFKSQSHYSDMFNGPPLDTAKPSHSGCPSDFILRFPLVSPNDKLNSAFPQWHCLHSTSLPSPQQFVSFLSFFPTVLYHILNTIFKQPIPTCTFFISAPCYHCSTLVSLFPQSTSFPF